MMMIFFFPMVFCFCLKTAGFVDLFNFRMLGRCFDLQSIVGRVIPPLNFADLC